MTLTLFHASDLHLSQADRDYGLAVLEELVYHCRRLQPDAWLLTGDLFDSHDDLLALAGELRAALAELGDLPVLMIPGNHELSGGKSPETLRPLAESAPEAPPRLLLETPFALWRPERLDAEFLAVPFQPSYADYPDWRPPVRERRWRVGLLHGVVNGMSYTGESEESEHGVIDPDLFARLGLHYAALGHIHARREERFGDCLAHYPGSARVWRRGESGPRRASRVVLDDAGVRVEPVELAAAGTYHERTVILDERGAPMEHKDAAALLAALEQEHGPQDWLRLELSGFVEARAPVEALVRALERGGSARFRRFEVDGEGVVEAERLRGHPLVRSFDAAWRELLAAAAAARDEAEEALLHRARRLALEEIQRRIAGE
jgi:DNA repair exonuclease SbcCD nuclease subunit